MRGGPAKRGRGDTPLDFDAIVIGSGAGGGAAAGELARAGRRVLVVERGARFDDAAAFQDERRMLFGREACEDRPIRLNGRRQRVFVGGVVGGSTALFGATLLRPGRCDFEPGRYYADHLPRELWEWPVGADELAPYLDRAEDLHHVAGDHTAEPPHLMRRLRAYASPPPPLEPVSERLRDARSRGRPSCA